MVKLNGHEGPLFPVKCFQAVKIAEDLYIWCERARILRFSMYIAFLVWIVSITFTDQHLISVLSVLLHVSISSFV